ncbi:MAG: hypothetical protein HY831_03235 [Candidatus Aenigmarchaeota archaeon]|nr:hypothetical protein [Candidatus Aenigmarchaeota archaeon]
MSNVGCPYRKICSAYENPDIYGNGDFMVWGFERSCDQYVHGESFPCPMYDGFQNFLKNLASHREVKIKDNSEK